MKKLGRARDEQTLNKDQENHAKVIIKEYLPSHFPKINSPSIENKDYTASGFYGSDCCRLDLRINCFGQATASFFSDTVIGDIRKEKMQEIWFGEKANEIRNKMKCPNPECELRDRCGGLWQRL